MKKQLLATLCLLATNLLSMQAQKTITVDPSGNGDYTTIQAAVDAAPDHEPTIIRIAAGEYDEQVNIGTRQKSSDKQLSLIGEGIDRTIISSALGLSSNPKAKDIYGTPALAVYANDFYAEGITFRNTSGKAGGQALALFVSGDRQTFYRCRIAGYQDTHRSKKQTRSYYRQCVVEGATDYIYAGGTCWFQDCQLRSVAGGYITAPEDITVSTPAADGTPIYLGFLFQNCTVTLADGVAQKSVALGRCWAAEKCGSIFMNCNLGNAVKDAGWETMGGNNGEKSYFGEYQNTGSDGNPVDVSRRISWSHQLSAEDYEKINTWDKVDALYRAATGNTVAFDPEAVIAAHQETATVDDYAATEGKLLAFPTARGFGKLASGGRGGKVVEVTNLDDSGEGSLRWALTETGKENATIVFRVGGVIHLQSDIRAKLKNVTIAGQTAPGDGILYRGGKLNLGGCENVIIRNLRGRLGVNEDNTKTKAQNFIAGGAIGIENAKNFIIDHCCFGWSGEENMTIYDNNFSTVQWCIIHEGLYNAGHPKGARGYGCQWGGAPATYHHNLLAHNDSRSPRINGASNENQDRNVFMEYFNNVNYNWGRQNSCYGGENEAGTKSSHECNFVGNYYKPGPARKSSSYFVEMSAARSGKTLNGPSIWYLDGNIMEGNATATADNWTAISNKTGYAVSEMKSATLIYPSTEYVREVKSRFDDYDVYRTPIETAEQAYTHVLEKAGTVNRDAVERRIVSEVANGTAAYKGAGANKGGIIDTPTDTEGWVDYDGGTPYVDNDHDGMDDEWEQANGFDPTDPTDGNTRATREGYTALEVFLNSLMGEVMPVDTGVDNLPADRTLTSVSVYTFNGIFCGRHAATAAAHSLDGMRPGVYIVQNRYADGTVKTMKVAKR